MCTVVMDVKADSARFVAVRDEDPEREWDRLGQWWPEAYPGVIGIRDRRAGGAWLAANPAEGRIAVLLNRADTLDLPENEIESRGFLVLDSVVGVEPKRDLRTHGFNLLQVGPEGAKVFSWDGVALSEESVDPGIHMIAHAGLDDPETARIEHWLPLFRTAKPSGDERWWDEWVGLLGGSGHIHPEDDRAIIRDNRPHGYPTLSLLYCVAESGPAGTRVFDEVFAEPGHWTPIG